MTEREHQIVLAELDALLDIDTDQFDDEQIKLFKSLCWALEAYEEIERNASTINHRN